MVKAVPKKKLKAIKESDYPINLVQKRLSDLQYASYNPREITDDAMGALDESVEVFGYVDPIIWNKRTGNVVGGHRRLDVLIGKSCGNNALVDVVELDIDESEEKALNVTLNNPHNQGTFDNDKLNIVLEEIKIDIPQFKALKLDALEIDIGIADVEEIGIDGSEGLGGDSENIKKGSLVEKFLIPPFSIFDTRQGYWRARKSLWIEKGLKSEKGRDQVQSSLLSMLKYNVAFNAETLGVSVFDPVVCELVYRWFCPENGTILDPFAGGSVRGVVAEKLGYKYTGIDLSERQVEENRKQAKELDVSPDWLVGDSSKIKTLLSDKFDFVFSCPPYFDLEKYSEDPLDLSNLGYKEFKVKYKQIIVDTLDFLKQDRFACFVVSDIRDKKGFYRCFPEYTVQCFLDAEVQLWNEIVLINVCGTLPMRAPIAFKASRKVGRQHQKVLIFYKGDPTKIKGNFPEINFEELECEDLDKSKT